MGFDIVARVPPHRGQIVSTRGEVADGLGDEIGTVRRNHDPAAGLLDEQARLAVGLDRREDRPAGSEYPVEPARDDVAGETGRETEEVEIGAGE
jgi:hypothetical protein